MAKGNSLVRVVAAVLIPLSLSACAATYVDHGYVPADSELSQVKVGESKAQVEQQIGSPSLQGLKGVDAWYYVQSRWRQFGPFKPTEVKRRVVTVSFDHAGRVAKIERAGLAQGNTVTMSKTETASTVKGVTLLQQLFRDLGRFNPASLLQNNRGQ